MSLKRWYVSSDVDDISGLCEICGEADASRKALLEGLTSSKELVEEVYLCCNRCASVILGDSPSPADVMETVRHLQRIENAVLGIPQQMKLFDEEQE